MAKIYNINDFRKGIKWMQKEVKIIFYGLLDDSVEESAVTERLIKISDQLAIDLDVSKNEAVNIIWEEFIKLGEEESAIR